MESPAMTRYITRKSKKRVFPGSSSSCMEPEVIEIPPPPSNRASKSKAKAIKPNELVFPEIIDVDLDDDHHDLKLTGRKDESNKKRKDTMGISLGSTSPVLLDLVESVNFSEKSNPNNKGKDAMGTISSAPTRAGQLDSVDGVYSSGSFNFFDLDDMTQMNMLASVGPAHAWSSFSSKAGPTFHTQVESAGHLHQVVPPPVWPPGPASSSGKPVVWSNFSYSSLPSQSNAANPPVNTQIGSLLCNMPGKLGGFFSAPEAEHIFSNEVVQDARKRQKRSSVAGSSSNMARVENEDVLKGYESFKKFDTVDDYSDHYYSRQSSEMKQPPKNWMKKIQEEWRILEKDLPDTIFVRAYESRMDLLRAVIIGAEGTPYHDGLFFFDVCFPSSYPNAPPLVHYHSGGLRINPNLYNCGKVCLSLLNTWTGHQKERWTPGTSTMLQVLVSIQGLILNAKPYFNEPGYAHSSGTVHGETASLQYNENTLILSLKTMVYTMKKPPKHFEDLVIGHFQSHVRDILMACKAYTEGVQVGCLVRGGVQDVDEGDKSCSAKFKADVASYIKTMIGAFKKIGAKQADEFLCLGKKKTPPSAAAPTVPSAPLVPSHNFYQ